MRVRLVWVSPPQKGAGGVIVKPGGVRVVVVLAESNNKGAVGFILSRAGVQQKGCGFVSWVGTAGDSQGVEYSSRQSGGKGLLVLAVISILEDPTRDFFDSLEVVFLLVTAVVGIWRWTVVSLSVASLYMFARCSRSAVEPGWTGPLLTIDLANTPYWTDNWSQLCPTCKVKEEILTKKAIGQMGKPYTTRAITIHAPVPWFLRKIVGQDICKALTEGSRSQYFFLIFSLDISDMIVLILPRVINHVPDKGNFPISRS
ncbi:hypothetical protein Tco_0959033, partial [Tanacetum coccineum]